MENVAIIMGGTSEESPISIQSGNTIKKYIDKNFSANSLKLFKRSIPKTE